jgi:tellurite resistance protein
MRIFIPIIFISLLFYTSCKKQVISVVNETITADTLVVGNNKNINSIGESLKPNAKKAVKNWEEYQLIDAILVQYYAISNAEALSNAKELSTLSKHLKDSIRDKNLKTPSVKARLNIFHNECMRLEDMIDIPAIKQEEVTFEIKKIIEAFSGINAKLNSIYSVGELEKELELDPDFQAMINNTPEYFINTNKFIKTTKPKKNKSLTPTTKPINTSIHSKKQKKSSFPDKKNVKLQKTESDILKRKINPKELMKKRKTLKTRQKLK